MSRRWFKKKWKRVPLLFYYSGRKLFFFSWNPHFLKKFFKIKQNEEGEKWSQGKKRLVSPLLPIIKILSKGLWIWGPSWNFWRSKNKVETPYHFCFARKNLLKTALKGDLYDHAPTLKFCFLNTAQIVIIRNIFFRKAFVFFCWIRSFHQNLLKSFLTDHLSRQYSTYCFNVKEQKNVLTGRW